MAAIVEFRAVSKAFGALKVIDALSFQLNPGQALGVVGPNGAGKTTMLNLLAGVVKPDSGTILLDDRDVNRLPSYARCRTGIARTYQIPRPFGGMTVFENVMVAATHGRGRSESRADVVSVGALERTGLRTCANQLAGSLSLLQRRRLELARALATEPRVLLLDEIAGGLMEHEVHSLVATIRDLRTEGISIIWIEHIVHALLSVVDRLLAIDVGRKLVEGDPHDVMKSPEVQRLYLGIGAA